MRPQPLTNYKFVVSYKSNRESWLLSRKMGQVMLWIELCSPQIPTMKPYSKMWMYLEIGTPRRQLRFKWCLKDGVLIQIWLMALLKKKKSMYTEILGTCECRERELMWRHRRRRHLRSSERGFRENHSVDTFISWISSFWNCERIHFHCSSPTVCGPLLRQTQQTDPSESPSTGWVLTVCQAQC